MIRIVLPINYIEWRSPIHHAYKFVCGSLCYFCIMNRSNCVHCIVPQYRECFRVWYPDFLDRSSTYIPLILYIYSYRRDDLARQYIYCKRSNIAVFEYFYLYILIFYTICRVCLIGFWKVKCTSLSRCADITWLQWSILDSKRRFCDQRWAMSPTICPNNFLIGCRDHVIYAIFRIKLDKKPSPQVIAETYI